MPRLDSDEKIYTWFSETNVLKGIKIGLNSGSLLRGGI